MTDRFRWISILPLCVIILTGLPGCGDSGGTATDGTGETSTTKRRAYISMGTAPVGGAFHPVGIAIAEVLNDNKGTNDPKVQVKGTKGSQENIRRLSQGKLQLALSNSAITYFAVRGESGWEQKYEMRAICTMAPNVAMFITKADSGIKSIADLKGKQVTVGPAGAGFDMFVKPIVEAHGVTYEDFTPKNATQSGAVDMLGDGSADAAFLGGAVPTGSVTQACATHDIFFVPFGSDEKTKLVDDFPFFQPITVPYQRLDKNGEYQKTYKGMTEDFAGLNVGSMQLITSADADEDLIYNITKTIWEHRADIAGKHAAGKAINEKNAARYTGTDFHPGAIKFYKEAGIWPEDAATDK